jgi:hypothetical protein
VRAGSYIVQVSTASDFPSLAVNDSDITSTTHTISSLSAYTLYYWRVKAVNAAGESSWSDVWNFMTGAIVVVPSVPVLLSPANGATDQPVSLALVWNSVSTATSYHVQIAIDTLFAGMFTQDSTITDTVKSDSGFAFSTMYYWRVRAKNAGGVSPWSEVRSFTVTSSGVLPGKPLVPYAFTIYSFSGTVRYSLPSACHVSLKYYDLRGRLAATLVNGMQVAGYYIVSVKNALPFRGTFIRVFEAGSFVKRELVAMVGK